MSHGPGKHLSDEQFTDLLMGEPASPALEAHLAFCEFCRSELSVVRESVSTFRSFGATWAERKGPSLVPVPSRWSLRLSSLPSWQAGLAAMALSGVVAFHFSVPRAATPSSPADQAALAVAAAAPTTSDLADDNRLMLSINQELSYRARVAVPVTDDAVEMRHPGHHGPDTVAD